MPRRVAVAVPLHAAFSRFWYYAGHAAWVQRNASWKSARAVDGGAVAAALRHSVVGLLCYDKEYIARAARRRCTAVYNVTLPNSSGVNPLITTKETAYFVIALPRTRNAPGKLPLRSVARSISSPSLSRAPARHRASA